MRKLLPLIVCAFMMSTAHGYAQDSSEPPAAIDDSQSVIDLENSSASSNERTVLDQPVEGDEDQQTPNNLMLDSSVARGGPEGPGGM